MKLAQSMIGFCLALASPPSAIAQKTPDAEQLQQWQQDCTQKTEQGHYQLAKSSCQRVVEFLEPKIPEHPDFATALNSLGELYFNEGEYKLAEPLFLRSLQIREKALGPTHASVAESLNNLGLLYQTQGALQQSEPLLQRSLQIWERALGPDHPEVATTLNNLAELYRVQGKYAQAEPLYLRSWRIRERTLGPDHPDLAVGLGNLALLYVTQGALQQAEPLYLRSLRIREKALGPNHPDLAVVLIGLAELYRVQGNYAQAEPLYLRSQRISEMALGPDHPMVARSLNNLALLYYTQHAYQRAEPLYLRSLQIFEKALGPEHHEVARVLNNLAELYGAQGNYAQAEPFYLRSLQIREKVLGPDHPGIALGLSNLAKLDVARGHLASALPRMVRALGISEHTLRQAATEARVTSLLDEMSRREEQVYGLLLRPGASSEVLRLALRTSLLRKGRAAEASLVAGWAIQQSLTSPAQLQRFERWQALRAQHETLFLRGPGKTPKAAYQEQLSDVRNRIDAAEQELAQAAPQLAAWKLPEPEQIIAAVAGKLPPDSAFVELLQVKPYRFIAQELDNESEGTRYVALVLFPTTRIERVDLGEAAVVDRAVNELLVAVRNPQTNPLAPAKALYEVAFAPLAAKLGKAKQVLLSPDGSLNLVPFAALHDGRQYLVDSTYQIRYLTSGRDLLRQGSAAVRQPALVLADPDFSGKAPQATAQPPRSFDDDPRSLYQGLSSLPQLPGARAEGEAVAQLLAVPAVLGVAATERLVRASRSPSILHIATHGLLLDGEVGDSSLSRSALLPASAAPPKTANAFERVTRYRRASSLSRAALVLAGAAQAERAPDTSDDGLLTAEEARSLNLYGTQLVVLSACDTGRGALKAGQGVYGLRRAFFAAGAEALVMSLWPVSDRGTLNLMLRYYRLLLDPHNPRPRISALGEAMQAVKAEHPHPYYWAPFIASGLDIPLLRQ